MHIRRISQTVVARVFIFTYPRRGYVKYLAAHLCWWLFPRDRVSGKTRQSVPYVGSSRRRSCLRESSESLAINAQCDWSFSGVLTIAYQSLTHLRGFLAIATGNVPRTGHRFHRKRCGRLNKERRHFPLRSADVDFRICQHGTGKVVRVKWTLAPRSNDNSQLSKIMSFCNFVT